MKKHWSNIMLVLILLLTACNLQQTSSSDMSGVTPAAHATVTAAHQPPAATHADQSGLPPEVYTPSATVEVQVNGGLRYQVFEGFGGTVTIFEDEGVYNRHDSSQPVKTTATQAQRADIAKLLFTDLGITRARVFPINHEPTNDNADPFTIEPSAFDWYLTDPLINFVELSRPYGLKNWWASFAVDGGQQQAWLRKADSDCALDPSMIDEDVELILAAALRFRDAGQELPYITINNEPDLCSPGYKIETGDYVTIIKRLGGRMRAEGLSTMIVVSDGWIPQNAFLYMQAALADPEARQYVGALAYHAYADGYDDPNTLLNSSGESQPAHAALEIRQKIRDLGAQYNLPIWMTEICYCVTRQFSDFDLIRGRLNHVHDELTYGNVAAFDVMNLLFLKRPNINDELVEINFDPDGALNRYEISTYGYLIGHYSRFILPGSVRLDVSSNDPRLRVVAFEKPDGKAVLVAINNNPYAVTVNITFADMGQMPTVINVLTSREGSIWESLTDITLNGSTATIVLYPLSVTTIRGQ